MKVGYGVVLNYYANRGFGFVQDYFYQNNVFFHINTIKKYDPKLACRIEEFGYPGKDRYADVDYSNAPLLWYEIINAEKGEKVKALFSKEDLHNRYKSCLSDLAERIEIVWRDVSRSISSDFQSVAEDLVGVNRMSELCEERLTLVKQKEKNLEELSNSLALSDEKTDSTIGLRFEISREQFQLDSVKNENVNDNEGDGGIEESEQEIELNYLIAEMADLGFKDSKEVSSYIVKKRLGEKYKEISGVVKMEKDGHLWDFYGGVPPHIFNKICERLGVTKSSSDTRVVDYSSFRDLDDK